MPLARRVPKLKGFTNPNRVEYAVINVAGKLKKSVDMAPYNPDPLNYELFDATNSDDVIFGGLGSDFLHGGAGEVGARLRLPSNLGTPGARNSRALVNAAPAIYQVRHAPVLRHSLGDEQHPVDQ